MTEIPPTDPPATSEVQPAAAPPDTGLSKDAKTWAMFGHLSALLGFIGVPFASILGPLIIWQIKKDELPFAGAQAKEALNFQISMFIYCFVGALLCFVLIGFIILPALVIADVVLTIMAGIKANEGIAYQYPFTLRLVK